MATARALIVIPRARSKFHVVQQLLLHLPLLHRARGFQQPIGQRALAVVDMGDDAEIADVWVDDTDFKRGSKN